MQHVVSQLIDKKSELKGELDFYKERIPKLEEVIKSIDISIQAFDPKFDIKAIKARKYSINKRYFKAGEVKTLILDLLREEGDYVPTHIITVELMKKKKLSYQDQSLKTHVQQTILNSLNRLHKENIIMRKGDVGDKLLMWGID